MNDNLRALTYEQWSMINVALCGARLEIGGNPGRRPKHERLDMLSKAIDALNDFEEIS